MKIATIVRVGGLGVAVGFALITGPPAIASAAPSAPDQNRTVAPASSAHATSNPWLRASVTDAFIHGILRLQAEQSTLVKMQTKEQERIAQERAALMASEAEASKDKAALASSQQLAQAAIQSAVSSISIGNLSAGDLKTVVNSEKAAAQAARTYVHDQHLTAEQKIVIDFQNRMSKQTQEIQSTLHLLEQQKKATLEALNRA